MIKAIGVSFGFALLWAVIGSPNSPMRSNTNRELYARIILRFTLPMSVLNPQFFFHFQPCKKPKAVDEVQELLTLYQPPDWLLCTVNRISPYVPQIGDEVGLISA